MRDLECHDHRRWADLIRHRARIGFRKSSLKEKAAAGRNVLEGVLQRERPSGSQDSKAIHAGAIRLARQRRARRNRITNDGLQSGRVAKGDAGDRPNGINACRGWLTMPFSCGLAGRISLAAPTPAGAGGGPCGILATHAIFYSRKVA